MLGAYVKSRRKVNGPILNKAAREVQGLSYQHRWLLWGSIAASTLLVTAAAVVALLYVNGKELTMVLPQRSLDLLPGIFVESPVVESPVVESPVVEASAAAEPEASLQWPDEAVARDDALAAAFLAQFTQWNIPLTTGNDDPCTQAISLGLRCFWGVGNLGSLISTDRPAILTLVDNEGRQFHATLLALEDELATVAFAHGIETVTVQDLEAHWQGHYQLLWRISSNGYTIIKPGSRGPGVTWLTKNLLAAGVKSVQVNNTYDEDVVAAVQAFQRNHGLVADGIAGRRTMIQLNSANNKTIPRLSNRGGG
jgi:general secretion pathway protein A